MSSTLQPASFSLIALVICDSESLSFYILLYYWVFKYVVDVFWGSLQKKQTATAQVLTKANEEINRTQQYLERLQAQKKGLMQQLLTGQKRV